MSWLVVFAQSRVAQLDDVVLVSARLPYCGTVHVDVNQPNSICLIEFAALPDTPCAEIRKLPRNGKLHNALKYDYFKK